MSSSTVSMEITAMAKEKAKKSKKINKTSPLFDDNDKCFGPLSATADSTTLEGHFLPGLYRRVSFFFYFYLFFLLLSRGSICATSQTARYGGPIFQPAARVRGPDGRADLGD